MKNLKKRILITGVSGLLGNNLAYYFKDRFNVLGLYKTHPVEINGIVTRQVDILSKDSIKCVIGEFRPDIIIHCASLTDIEYSELNKESADLINVSGTRNIVSVVADNTKIVYISSDSVYDGIKGNFVETDMVDPQNYYGLSKYNGELEALKKRKSLVLRTNIFGWNIQEKNSIAEWIMHELDMNHEINGFRDVYFSSIYTFDLAKILEKAIEQDLAGIYNCGSRDSISKYEFALLIAQFFCLNQNLVKPISIDHFSFKAKRGKNLSLNVDKLSTALNLTLPSINESLLSFYNDFKNSLQQNIGKQMIPVMKTQAFLNYGKQSIDNDDIQAVVEALQSANLTQGPKIFEFESALCNTVEAPFSVSCNSGTSALHMACLAAGVGPGDEVITSPITFVASANCALYCRATPVFADIDPRTYNISATEIEKKITGKTRAVIPVHFAGQSCDMEGIQEVVRSAEKKFGKKIFIIEDACHALGSIYKNTKVGSCIYADMAVMSFHPVKHITTAEGGAVFTKDISLFKKLKLLRSHGITSDPEEFLNKDIAFQHNAPKERNPWYYEQIDLGFNYRITDIQCALGLSQIRKIDDFKMRRRAIVNMYNDLFKDNELIHIPHEVEKNSSNFHLYILLFDFKKLALDRAQLMLKLRERNIQTQVHYIPVHLQSFYRKTYGYGWGDYPNAEWYYEKCLSIPLFPAMTDEDVKRVFDEINSLTSDEN
ncbi:MAG: UDP-4-amino-4,6-dideoxy-N-acetyl-beta-L-altrosamine transaminase [Desulfobacula sp.]